MFKSIRDKFKALRSERGEEGFTLAEVLWAMLITGIVGAMGTSFMMNTLNLQKDFMERQISVELSQATLMISNIRVMNPDATPLEMRQRFLPTSQMENRFIIHGGMENYIMYVVSDMFNKCYKATPEDSFGSVVDCSTVPEQKPLSEVIAEDEASNEKTSW